MHFKKLTLLFVITVFIGLVSCSSDKPKKAKSEKAKTETKKATPTKTASTEKETTPIEETPKTDPVPPEQIAKAKEIIKSVKDTEMADLDVGKLYKTYCAACHGFDGKLKVNGAKDLTKSKISLAESVAQVYHGKGLMTPFKGLMKDAEIVAVGKFIETMRK